MKSKLPLAAILAVLVTGVFVACQPAPAQMPITPAPPPVRGFQTEAVSSSTVQLDWEITSPSMSFNLERESVAAGIEAIGVIEGSAFTDTNPAPGTTYKYRATAITANAPGKTLESKSVLVPEAEAEGSEVSAAAVSTISLKPSKPSSVLIGQKTTFTAITKGDNSNRVRWERSGGSLSIMNNKAIFSSSKEGNFSVTTISLADSKKRVSAKITVQKGLLSGIRLNATPNPVTVGLTSTLEVGFDGQGSYGTGIDFKVSSGTTSIQNIGQNRYQFKATAFGTYVIQATSRFNPSKSASITLKVGPTLSSLKLTTSPSTVHVNQAASLSMSFTGSGPFGHGVTITVAPSGTVTGAGPYSFVTLTPGTYTFTATSTFDTSKTSSTTLTVRPSVFGSDAPGAWSGVLPLPIPPIHAGLLPTGKVLFWAYDEDSSTDANKRTRTYLWNPVLNDTPTRVDNPDSKLFCSAHSLLPDGRFLTIGGIIRPTPRGTPQLGTKDTNIFDPSTSTWSKAADLQIARYYPSSVPLANGDVLAVAGTNDTNGANLDTSEVWQSTSSLPETDPGRYRLLSSAKYSQGWYPMAFQAPNGNVFNVGPQPTMGYLDTAGTGTWTSLGNRVDPANSNGNGQRTFGNAVMYEPGKIVLIGGADPPTNSAMKIDINGSSPVVTQVGSMVAARRQHNATILADGSVLVTGGTSGPGFNDALQSLLTTELWNPATGQFKTLKSAATPRIYHSIALLLPDARVLSAGGDGSNAPSYPNGEIFTPPYLLNSDGTPATRPSIASAPTRIAYNSSFAVTVDTTDIARMTLIKLSSVTHSTNFDQRFLNLSFTKTGTSLSVTAPSSGNVAPPGYYMLFAFNAAGVPSIAKMLKLD